VSASNCSNGPETKEFVSDFVNQPFTLDRGERRIFLRQQTAGESRDFLMELVRLEHTELGQIHSVDEHAVKARFHVLEALLIADRIVSQWRGHSAFSD
jgi:hypothetical protein